MRLALWIALFVLGVAGVVVPTIYLRLSSQLPPLDSELDLRSRLRRASAASAEPAGGNIVTGDEWPDFARLPRDLVAMYVSQMGCPAYFQSTPDDGVAWLWRMFSGLWGIEPPGDGRCERLVALRIAASLGVGAGASQSVAANKIHRVLEKHQLIAYDLSSTAFEPKVVGVEAAAKALFKKELQGLQLAQLAELMLALPPHEFYEELKLCRNASLIRQSRDYVLSMLASHSLVSLEHAVAAQAQPVACTRN
ncbi:MAG TPA: transglycosylase domain-containing protein [Myxococcaceae bacterium]|nr:transglycosylase domain-containing protein [Myxococcaceae bacterium]